jgi:two-component sensor histidine kinase
VVDILGVLKGAELHRSTLFLLISEAYNNALDHGILGLDSKMKESEDGFLDYYLLRTERLEQLESGSIDIDIKYDAPNARLNIVITDSGEGFDIQDVVDLEDNEQEHGRGTLLLHELASSVQYNEKGNQITIDYSLEHIR